MHFDQIKSSRVRRPSRRRVRVAAWGAGARDAGRSDGSSAARVIQAIQSTRRSVMRRRNFLILLGAAVAWPRPVIGQSPSKVYRVGLLSAVAPIADNSFQGAALIRGFTQRGYTLGRNLAFERRGAEGHIDRLPRL